MVRRILGSVLVASQSVSGREAAPEEVSAAMVRRILGSVVVAFPLSVFGREGTPEELSEAMACRILGFLVLPPHHLFPGERVRQRMFSGERVCQRSYLKPWRVAIWAPFCCLHTICFRARGHAKGAI